MKRAQLLGIGIAAVAGLGAFVGMQSIIKQPPPQLKVEKTVNSTQVLVAQTAMGLGSTAVEAKTCNAMANAIWRRTTRN